MQFLQLFIALTLGAHHDSMAPCKVLQGRLDVGQQFAVTLDQMSADAIECELQAVAIARSKLRNRVLQRDHVRLSSVAVSLNTFQFSSSDRRLNFGSLENEAGVAQRV